jgi:hypothetical protein
VVFGYGERALRFYMVKRLVILKQKRRGIKKEKNHIRIYKNNKNILIYLKIIL